MGKYLSKCLESLINQTLKDIEVICVNDGSTDNSLSILKEYANINILGILPDYGNIANLTPDTLIADILNKVKIEETFGLEIAKLRG